jgi:polysaccharide pyruvyl transferase CsaB
MAHAKHKVVLCGHYGSTNIGDEAIGLSLISLINKQYLEGEISVLSFDKERSRDFYEKYAKECNIKTFYLIPVGIRSLFRGVFKGELWHTLKEIKTCDKFILGGGGLFTDEKLFAVILWGIQAFFAYKYKKPVYIVGQSVGPLKTRIGKWIVKKIFSKAKYINVRDEESKILLKSLKINNEIIVTCDPVFALENLQKNDQNSYLEKLNKKVEQLGYNGYFVFTIRPWIQNYELLYNKFIQVIAKIGRIHKLLPVFIPFQLIKENDTSILNKIIDQNGIKDEIEVKSYTENIFEILDIIAHAKFTIGVRLHSILFSILTGAPFIAISYSPKIENFLKMEKLERFISKPDDEKKILELVDFILQNRNDLSTTLKDTSKKLKQKFQIKL